jgi:DNA-binding NarL/FixJ family response regulator
VLLLESSREAAVGFVDRRGPLARVRVLLATRNRLLRDALSRILRKRADLAVSGECFHCSDLPATIAKFETDVVLMDSPRAEDCGLQVVLSLQKLDANLQIILIGMEEDEALFLEAVRAGVAGYLLSDASAADVTAAIRAVSQGDAVCPPRLCRALFRTVANNELPLPRTTPGDDFGLTRRQRELVPMIARGLSNKEIASQLHLSEQTVKNHIHRMLQKVGVERRLEVAEIVGSTAL